MPQVLHIFSGTFGSEAQALRYTEKQWEQPAPDDSWTAEAYAAWEKRNPTWSLKRDLKRRLLNPDFIETIYGPDKLSYLQTQLVHAADHQKFCAEIPQAADTLVLIMSTALDGEDTPLASTPALQYHGAYPWKSTL